jgi:hypothetical protein
MAEPVAGALRGQTGQCDSLQAAGNIVARSGSERLPAGDEQRADAYAVAPALPGRSDLEMAAPRALSGRSHCGAVYEADRDPFGQGWCFAVMARASSAV